MELQQLRYFLALARLGNFTRAAEACHVAQPTLSQQIAKLEQEFGVPLFDRLARGAELTAAGRVLRERAEQALGLLDDAKASVSADASAGRLTVAAIPTIAPYFLPKVLLRFAAEYPGVKLEVREETTADCLAKLTAGEIDLAVLALPVRGDHLNAQTFFTEELLLAVAEGHRLATKPQVRLKDLTDESFVLLHEAHCLSGQAMNFCTRHALAPLITAGCINSAPCWNWCGSGGVCRWCRRWPSASTPDWSTGRWPARSRLESSAPSGAGSASTGRCCQRSWNDWPRCSHDPGSPGPSSAVRNSAR